MLQCASCLSAARSTLAASAPVCLAPACVCAPQGLEFVSLQNVGCSVHACNALSELVPNGSALAGLHLYNNMTGDEGAEHVARLLSRCPAMSDFKLASSRVGPAGGISIAKALSGGEQAWLVLGLVGIIRHTDRSTLIWECTCSSLLTHGTRDRASVSQLLPRHARTCHPAQAAA